MQGTGTRPKVVVIGGLEVWSGATANDLHQAMTRIRLLACVILDGTLIPIDRVHDHKPYYSGSTDGTG